MVHVPLGFKGSVIYGKDLKMWYAFSAVILRFTYMFLKLQQNCIEYLSSILIPNALLISKWQYPFGAF
jgi:hypothetical protein